jgi:Fe-S-cluster containining protein
MIAKTDPILLPIQFGSHQVPGIWQYYLPQSVNQCHIPTEVKANCGNCPKIITDGFRPDYRCCTYHPKVPNYSLGLAIIAAGAGEKVVTTLSNGGYLTPEGFVSTPQRWALYLADVQDDLFGKSKDVLCPFLSTATGGCNIYAFRNAVCSTFFCHNDFGENGKKYWMSLQTLVTQCELSLTQWVMAELGIDPQAYFQKINNLSDKVEKVADESSHAWTSEIRKYLWGSWYGREVEFFRACAQLVSDKRDLLWEIANETEIYEAEKFDRASLRVVPKRLHGQVSEDDLATGETIPPEELLKSLVKVNDRMTAIPAGRLIINPKVTIKANPLDSAEAKHYEKSSHCVILKVGRKVPETYYISEATAKFLRAFTKPTRIDLPLLQHLQNYVVEDPLLSISQWSGKKVLITAR